MNVVAATAAYESWAQKRIGLVAADVALKHQRMREGAFPFMRATFYRWAAIWPEACPELLAAPKLLAVGDLHAENFGTWRDSEGRLVWGINDFDEADTMPYAIDLVRLATSALLAGRDKTLSIKPRDAAAAILKGYRETITSGSGAPFVLEEEHPELRAMALGEERDPVRFWAKLNGQRTATPPARVRAILQPSLPLHDGTPRFVHRIAGLGSLGRARYVAIADASGGLVAREAKAMLPSAYGWACGTRGERLSYMAILKHASRACDPFVAVEKGWLLRRLAPHCTRIELNEVPRRKDEWLLLEAMGRETANIHLGSRAVLAAVRRDLKKRPKNWLFDASTRMADATMEDWKAWRAA